MSTFQKAERKQVKLKIALTGPSGSGKTFSALLIAAGIGKRIAVLDTENRSASLYADAKTGLLAGIEFDTLALDPPYTIPKYLEAITVAEKEGYDVLLIDSISHAWAGEGGLLAKKEALDSRGGRQNQYTNWAPITKEHEAFKARLLNAGIHLICTMRSKQDYVLEVVDGKSQPKKIGMAPIQRDGMEYEFTVVFDLAMDHSAAASKDRTSLFDGQIFKPSKETAKKLMAWLKDAKPAPAPEPAPELEPEHELKPATPEQIQEIMRLSTLLVAAGEKAGSVMDRIRSFVKKQYQQVLTELDELRADQADSIIKALSNYLAKKESAKEARA